MEKNKKKILIAEDDKDILEAMTIVLTDAGYDVVGTQSGKTALRLSFKKPDLILLDIWLSGTDGRDICKKIKTNRVTRKIPIIIVSAAKNIAEKAAQSCADDFLSKPFDIADLIKKVERYLPN